MSALRVSALALITTAAAWDVLGAFDILPPWWPPVSYVLAGAAIAAGCAAVLLMLLTTRRSPALAAGVVSRAHASGAQPDASSRPRQSAGGQLLAVGILLAAWLLRGHAEIPPDIPLVAAEVLAAALYALFTLRRRN